MILLNLDENNRILSIGEVYAKPNPESIIVESTPQGDFNDYRFVNGTYIYDPLPPQPMAAPQPSAEDRRDAQLAYTAMMTDTLLPEPAQDEEATNV